MTARTTIRRRSVIVAMALTIAACTSGGTGEEATEAGFVEVEVGEDWNDVAARISGCDPAPDDLDVLAQHLRDANPVVADVGLGAGNVVAFDVERLERTGCAPADERETSAAEVPSTTAGGDVEATADPVPVDADPDDTSGSDADSASEETPSESKAEATAVNLSILFEEDFADPDSMDRYQWQVHHKPSFNGTPESWLGDHDLDCAGPPTTRTVQVPDEGPDPGETAYICAPGGPETSHLMTTFRSTGYAQVAFSPNEVFDGVGTVCWDQNHTDLGSRKWTQVIVVPEDTFQDNDQRLDYVKPGIEDGPGAAGVFLTDDVFLLVVQTGSTVTHLGQGVTDQNFRGFTNEDKKRRFRTCIEDLEDGTVRIELEREDETETRVMQGAFPDGPARVIFQDDTYNSTKSSSPVEAPFTWHWDNLLIAS